jgi:hypothetical protein
MATEIRKVTCLRWRQFLASEFGTEGMLFLREKIPSVSPGDAHQMIFNAGRAEGFKQAIDTISEIIAVEQQKEQNLEN